MAAPLTIALSKGRIFQETLPLLAAAGIVPTDDPETSRKLILDTDQPDVKLVIIRATDVPTYVQYGAADLGVAGKDVLLEHGGEGLYEPLDLRIARCRLMVAGRPDQPPPLAPPSDRYQIRQYRTALFRRPRAPGGNHQTVRFDGAGAAGGVGGLHR
jgi:ATP phosphoribosyltransferase